jgi:hypothetical protein
MALPVAGQIALTPEPTGVREGQLTVGIRRDYVAVEVDQMGHGFRSMSVMACGAGCAFSLDMLSVL